MILVVVGTQFPFDRLVRTVDDWAGVNATNNVIAQIGPSDFVPAHIAAHAFLAPAEFEAFVERASLVIAHCGMGAILSALALGKPIIVMPRSAAKGEHRNEHQFATARRFLSQPGVSVAWDELELRLLLDLFADRGANEAPLPPIAAKAPRALTDRLHEFLRSGLRR